MNHPHQPPAAAQIGQLAPPSFPRHLLGVCMIVKNEERLLARCLDSVRGWAGEVVVIDTGSTDETVAIAQAARDGGLPIVMGHFAWCDDFAAARNAALDLATGDWTLVLDADERWVVTDPAELARALQRQDIAGFSCRIHDLRDDGSVAIAQVFRLFRRRLPGMRYRGEMHEQIAAVADGQVTTSFLAGVHIVHDGYTSQATAGRGKRERNLRLARKLVASRPTDPYAWYVLGQSTAGDDGGESRRAYQKALDLLAALPGQGAGEAYVLSLHLNVIQGHLDAGGSLQALQAVERAIALFAASPDLRFQRANLALKAGDYATAAADFEACLAPEAAQFFLVINPAAIAHGARTGLGQTWLQQGRNVEAEEQLAQAVLTAPPGYTAPHRILGLIYLQRGAWAEALPLLEAARHNAKDENGDLAFNLGWCQYKLERFTEAEATLAPWLARADVQHLVGKARLEAGRGHEALPILLACPLPAALLARGWAQFVTGQATNASVTWEQWLRAGAADWGTKDTLAMFLFLLGGGARPSGQPERPAEPLRDMDQWFRLLLRHQRFDEVEQVIQRAPQLGDRLYLPLRKKWAATLAKEGFYDLALHLLIAAREAEPTDADLYYWLGHVSLYQRHVNEARTMWEACLRFAPEHSLARQGLSLLKGAS